MTNTASFTDDQIAALLEFLESQVEAGYTIEDVVEGIKDGTITRSTYLASQSE